MKFVDALYHLFDRKWLWWTIIVLVIADFIVCGFTWGKHRVVIIEGKAWAWVNAPPGAESLVYAWDDASPEAENWTPPPGMELEPLKSVYVTFYAVYGGTRELGFCISSRAGVFHQHTTPWEITNDITIELGAERAGYQTVNATFLNRSNYFLETRPNVVDIILVPSANVTAD